MPYTDKQLEAINTRGSNLLVTAAAGSGKTAVLVERIIKMIIEENVDVDKLLVMTFTEAAAAEMKERIYKAIMDKLAIMPDNRHLQRQVSLMSKAYIMTIHSFCMSVIRKYFYEIDLDPNFRVADKIESKLMLDDAFEETLEEMFENDTDGEFGKFYDGYGRSSDSSFKGLVMSFYDFAMSTPYPVEWIEEIYEAYEKNAGKPLGESQWAELIKEDIKITLEGAYNDLQKVQQMLRETSAEHNCKLLILDDVDGLKQVIDSFDEPLDVIGKKLNEIKHNDLNLPTPMSAADKIRCKNLRGGAKTAIAEIKNLYFRYDDEFENEISKGAVKAMRCLCDAVLSVNEKYSQKKRSAGLLDFDDLEHFCIKILTKRNEDGEITASDTAIGMKDVFHEILVDEYQDSNEVQEVIFKSIAREDNLFVVGDMKQSVYRFRHANPQLFRHKKDVYQEKEGAKDRKVTLAQNFRSSANVLKAVNYIFSMLMSNIVGEMVYDSDEYLYNGLKLPEKDKYGNDAEKEHTAEVHIIDVKGVNSESEYSEDQYEAALIAKRIRTLIDSGYTVYDKREDKYRKVTYRDIAILLRSPSKRAASFVDILNRAQIPVYCESLGSFFESTEIRTVISTLEVIDNPYQDIPLIATMRSPMFSFDATDLAKIRVLSNSKYFYSALKNYVENTADGDTTKTKAQRFLTALNSWRERAGFVSTSELIENIYNETGYFSSCGVMYDGAIRQANLNLLSQRAKDFEKTSLKGLFSFINYIKKLKMNGNKLDSAKLVSENSDVVRIISMHKSKGLEFPVVFVSGLGKRFNLRDLSEPVVFHEKLGFGPDFVDHTRRIRGKTMLKNIISRVVLKEMLSEEMRVLYVAMTRARDKLILTGTITNAEKTFPKWESYIGDKISEGYLLDVRTFVDMLGPCFMAQGMFNSYASQVYSDEFRDDESKAEWKGFVTSPQTVSEEERELPNPLDLSAMQEDARVDEIFSYEYPYLKSAHLPTKMTVTELKRKMGAEIDSEDTSFKLFDADIRTLPDFVAEKEGAKTGAQFGTFVHYLMENIQIRDKMDRAEVASQLEGLCEKGLIGKDEISDNDIDAICTFFDSKTGREIIKYKDSVRREVPFVINVKATDIYSDMAEDKYKDETVLVQGVIDCFYETPDGTVILDYKTDRIKKDVTELKDKYQTQLDFYEKAINGMTGKKVCRKVIYSFAKGKEIEW